MANFGQLFLTSEKLLVLLCIIESIYINDINANYNPKPIITLPVYMFFSLTHYIGSRLIYNIESQKLQIRRNGTLYFICFYIWHFLYSIYVDIYIVFNQYQNYIGIWLFIIKLIIIIFMLAFIICTKKQPSENKNLYLPFVSIILLAILIVDFSFYRAQNLFLNVMEFLLFTILFFYIREE